MKEYIITLILALLVSQLISQPNQSSHRFTSIENEQVNEFIEKKCDELKIAGLSFAMIKEGCVTLKKHLGVRNQKNQEPINDQTIFEAASMTKPVFAWLIMKYL